MSNDTDFLFPVPSQPPSEQSPYHWPGVTPQSTSSLLKVLKDNHKRWHIFFNDKRFHNHVAHHALAVWALGVDGSVIEAGYECDSKQQRSLYKSPEPITESNFEHHLGDERYYQAYVDFFTDYIRKHGMSTAFETFIFSKRYNLGEKKPEMLSRFLSGLVHPTIHVGYGAEFGLPGLMVEGLAQTAIHFSDVTELLPTSFFDSVYAITDRILANTPDFVASAKQKVEQVAAHLDTSVTQGKWAPLKASIQSSAGAGNVHALTILARVMADDRLDHPEDVTELDLIQNIVKKHGELIQHYASQWTINIQRSGEIYAKAQELAWMNVILYGIAGWTWAQKVKGGNEGEFNADFFFMHLVTSSLFLPSLLAYLRHYPHSQVLLLRSYLAVCLSWYVARGRPKLDIKDFFMSPTSTAYPLPISQLPTPHKDVLPGRDKPQARVPDPWLPIIQTTVVHQDDHLAKAIRALANYASKWGTVPAGTFFGPGTTGTADEVQGEKHGSRPIIKQSEAIATELPEAEYLDGTLFIRVAGLTVARMGRVGQGEAPAEFWDLGGFYKSLVPRKQGD